MNRLEYCANFGYYLYIIFGCICQVTHGRRTIPYSTMYYYTNPHHTVDKNGVHLKITTFSCIKLKN